MRPPPGLRAPPRPCLRQAARGTGLAAGARSRPESGSTPRGRLLGRTPSARMPLRAGSAAMPDFTEPARCCASDVMLGLDVTYTASLALRCTEGGVKEPESPSLSASVSTLRRARPSKLRASTQTLPFQRVVGIQSLQKWSHGSHWRQEGSRAQDWPAAHFDSPGDVGVPGPRLCLARPQVQQQQAEVHLRVRF